MIDTFYRIQSLHNLGIRIHLHCFEYGRPHTKELESLCETISYYPRRSGLYRHFSLLPYIVSSRESKVLLDNLIRNDYPVLFDGLHSTYYINHPALADRRKLVRVHNIEHRYYRTLANNEPNMIKKLYFLSESLKLKRYEKVLGKIDYVLAISQNEQDYFNNEYHNSVLLPPFHPFNESESLHGIGEYILYHGDLSVNENVAISEFLISEVFSRVPFPCIIAGKNPPGYLIMKTSHYKNIKIVPDPENDEMTRLIRHAHIHILPALASNGFKLKLLMALYAGRHCLVNPVMTKGNHLDSLCHVADSGEAMVEKIHLLMTQPFTGEMVQKRKEVLSEYYNNIKNAKRVLNFIFKD